MALKAKLKQLAEPFKEVNICEDSGIVLMNEDADADYVKKIRLWNLIEAFMVYGLILLIVWVSMLDTSLWWMWAGLGALLFWTLIFSPLIHYKYEKNVFLTEKQRTRGTWFYVFECRGLGSPKRYYFSEDGEQPYLKKYFKQIISVTVFLDILFIGALIGYDAEASAMLGAVSDNLVAKIFLEIALIALVDFLLIFLAYPVMFRLDNFDGSVKFMIAFILFTIPFILIFNLFFQLVQPALGPVLGDNPYFGFQGDTAAERLLALNLIEVMGQWAGYVFWGWLQQLLFLGVFNTYFARAFEIREKKQRRYACLCSALFFGLIHLPNFWLSIFTFISGYIWAYFFMQSRNLWAMGIIHGLGGTLLNKLAPINFSVGPSEVS
ncbi:MAG: CPBP family intramembrane glutamic endopeptidase [Promethearchaeia archaeon]